VNALIRSTKAMPANASEVLDTGALWHQGQKYFALGRLAAAKNTDWGSMKGSVLPVQPKF